MTGTPDGVTDDGRFVDFKTPPPPVCNRSACRRPGARWWSQVERAFYCDECAGLIAPAPGGRGRMRLGGPEGPPMEDFFPTPAEQLPNDRFEWEWQYKQATRRAPREEEACPACEAGVPVQERYDFPMEDGRQLVLYGKAGRALAEHLARAREGTRSGRFRGDRPNYSNTPKSPETSPMMRNFASLPLTAALALTAYEANDEVRRSKHARGHQTPDAAKTRAAKKRRRALEKAGRRAARTR